MKELDMLASKIEPGQGDRCGPNFKFLPTLPSGIKLTVTITGTSNPGSVKAKLYRDQFGEDEFIADLSDGATLDAAIINTDDEYYIASPSGATGNFIVYFSA
jgi:hypothetical protein